MAGLIALFDANALIHRSYHAVKPLTTTRGELTNAVYGFTAVLLKAFADLKPEYAAVAFDKSKKTFRHLEYAEYKANRARTADDLAPQFARVREVVAALGLPIFETDGFEADDVLGTLARQAEEGKTDVVVVTGDTDALQLVRPGVRVYTPSRGVTESALYDIAGVREKYGLEPAQVVDYKALKGDSSDNIKGVPGIGEKTAQRLLQRYGTIERLIELPDDLEPKLVDPIRDHIESLKLGKRLTKILDDVPVELDLERARVGNYDRNKATALMRELEFRSLIDRLPPTRGSAPARGAAPAVRQASLFDEGGVAPPPGQADDTPPAALGEYRTVTTAADLGELARELAAAPIFALDTLASGDDLFALSFATRIGAGWYVPVDGFGIKEIRTHLGPVLADPRIAKVAHNAKSDIEVLHASDLELEGLAFDPMIAAFVLDTTVRAFGLKDLSWGCLGLEIVDPESLTGRGKAQVALTDLPSGQIADCIAGAADVALRLREMLEPRLREQGLWELFATVEMPCVPVLARMEEAGVLIDVPYFQRMSDQMAETLARVESEIYYSVGHEFNVNSPIQLGKVLFDELKLPRGKRTRTGWSTDAETLEELRGVHPVIDGLFEYRQISKLKSTYADALPLQVSHRDGRVHTSYNQIGAGTGRLSSSDPNLQNIPIRTDMGRAVRRGFVAGGPDLALLGADYTQAELRILAHITRDHGLVSAFAENQDIHRATASTIFNLPAREVTADQRRLAKMVNFGIAYGLGEHGLSTGAGISRQEAGQFIRSYLERYPGIARYIEETKLSAMKDGYVETLMGRRVFLPEITSINRTIRASAERRAINAPIQGSNADFMKVAMARIDAGLREAGLRTRLILQVHDELVFEAPRDEIAPVGALARKHMIGAFPLDPPLEVELKVGTNWCDVE